MSAESSGLRLCSELRDWEVERIYFHKKEGLSWKVIGERYNVAPQQIARLIAARYADTKIACQASYGDVFDDPAEWRAMFTPKTKRALRDYLTKKGAQNSEA
jgi:hypothetical protein